jgi:hypothetical protein
VLGFFEQPGKKPCPSFFRVRHDIDDTWQCREFIRTACRVAASRDDARAWILSRDASDGLARALIGAGRDRARVDDDHVRAIGGDGFAAASAELGFEREGIRLIDAAAEGHD